MIFLLATLLTGLAIFLLLVRPYAGFLLVLAAKPLIDMTWGQNISGVNLLKVIGVAMPLLLLPRLLASSYWQNPINRPWYLLGMMFFLSQIISVFPYMSVDSASAFDLLFRTLNTLLAFLMIPAFATSEKRFKQILIALIIAGIAPILVSIYGDVTGTVWRERTTVGLSRNIGLYHNAVSIRHYGLQSLIAALMYLEIFKPRKLMVKAFLFSYLLACLAMTYQGYTRGAIATLAVWAIIWVIFHRKIHWGILIAVGLVLTDFLTQGGLVKEFAQLFSKEISFYDGTISDNRRILNGRFFVWEIVIEEWKSQEFVNKIFGGAHSGGATHNEILRSLMANGIFGVFVYSLTILAIIFWTVKQFFSFRRAKLAVYGLMILAMYCLESMGSTPGLYPQYQWFCFGLIGMFLLNGDRIANFTEHRRRNELAPLKRKALHI